MKKYLIFGTIVCVVIALVAYGILVLIGIVMYNQSVDNVNMAQNAVFLRYYDGSDFDNAQVITVLVGNRQDYRVEVPQKDGYLFVGLFTTDTDTQYVASDGTGMVPLTGDIVLYAKYVEKVA